MKRLEVYEPHPVCIEKGCQCLSVVTSAANMEKALNLLEAYHYKTEYDLDTMRCKSYTCRICGASVSTDDLPAGGSVADAVVAIPHQECIMPTVRKLVGNTWATL